VHQEKRRTPRIFFVAVAEVTDQKSGRELTGQVSELSAYGCYVDMENPLSVGNLVTLKIFAASQCFDAKAKIIYAHDCVGMGIAFQEVSLQGGNLLRQWLLKGIRREPN
jgi:PilZ domain.